MKPINKHKGKVAPLDMVNVDTDQIIPKQFLKRITDRKVNVMKDKVLLTGISGWIAKHIAIDLLNSGYEVLGTIRNKELIEQTKQTLASQNAPLEKLSFVELDLLHDAGWDEAAKGCKYIMHVASPFPLKTSRNREGLVPPAKDGTIRVLKAGVNAGVERIILTSSIVAMFRKPNRTNPYTFGENDWSDASWSGCNDYFVSKIKAERAAWDFMMPFTARDAQTLQ